MHLLLLCMAVLGVNESLGCLGVRCQMYICILVHHNTQHSSLGSLVFAHLGSIREKTIQLYMYITHYYNYISLLLQYHKSYIDTHLSVLFVYSS